MENGEIRAATEFENDEACEIQDVDKKDGVHKEETPPRKGRIGARPTE